jgi:hypothetical protein
MRKPNYFIKSEFKGKPVLFEIYVVSDETEVRNFNSDLEVMNMSLVAKYDGKIGVSNTQLFVDLKRDVLEQLRPHIKRLIPKSLSNASAARDYMVA